MSGMNDVASYEILIEDAGKNFRCVVLARSEDVRLVLDVMEYPKNEPMHRAAKFFAANYPDATLRAPSGLAVDYGRARTLASRIAKILAAM